MRISHCESNCTPPLCYLPCLPQSKGARDGVPAAPSPADAAAAAAKPPSQQKIGAVLVDADADGDGDGGDKEEEVAPKSSLKKADCRDGKGAAKGNVKWLDLLGKDLAEIREFEPSESGDSQDDGDENSACACVIQ